MTHTRCTRHRVAGWCLAVLAVLTVPATEANEEPGARAAALIGLARVARDTNDFVQADRYFREAAELHGFQPDLLREHFWVVTQVDRTRAMDLARTLARAGGADAAVYGWWLQSAVERGGHEEVVAVAREAERGFGGHALWPRRLGESLLATGQVPEAAAAFARAAAAEDATADDRALLALTLERAGDLQASAHAWTQLADSALRERADWAAGRLRVRFFVEGPAATADDLATHLTAHPEDRGSRALLVEAFVATHRPGRALAVLAPLTRGPDAHRWLRRESELAINVGDERRAREALNRLVATPHATPDDRWRLLELSAPYVASAQVLTELRALTNVDEPCRSRSLVVADLSDSDAVFADLALGFPPTCTMPERLVLRAVRFLDTSQSTSQAERLLQHRLAQPAAPESVTLTLAGLLMRRGASAEADALLRQRLAELSGAPSEALAEAAAWARHATGESREAWALIRPHLHGDARPVEDTVRWAGLALAAGDLAAAESLARPGLHTTSDIAARHVLAVVAGARGRFLEAYNWLVPVSSQLVEPGHVLVWVDAVALVDGPARARAAASSLADRIDLDVNLAGRMAVWAAEMGDRAEADIWRDRVAFLDPLHAARLDLQIALAFGDPRSVLARFESSSFETLDAGVLSLVVTAALDAAAWTAASAAVAAGHVRGLDAAWLERKQAQLEIGRDGHLSASLRSSLDQRWAAGERDEELKVRLAQDDHASGRGSAALARLGYPDERRGMTVALREATAGILLAQGRWSAVLDLLDPGGPDVPVSLQVARARALASSGETVSAHEELLGLGIAARSPEAWRLLADTAPDPQQHLLLLTQAVAAHPESANLWAALAWAHHEAGDPEAVRVAASRALALVPSHLDAWRVRLLTLPRHAASRVEELREAGDRFDSSDEALMALGQAAVSAGALDSAAAAVVDGWLARASGAMPQEALRLRTQLAVATGDWDRALQTVADARRLRPDDEGLQHLESQLHAWSGRHTAARRLYELWLRPVAAHAEAWREYGRLLAWMQDVTGSARAYELAERLQPSPGLSAERQTKAALARGAWRRAAAEASRWLAVEPASMDAMMDQAVALDRMGNFAGAAAAYAALATRDSIPADQRSAAARYGRRAHPRAALRVESESATGFGEQRLLSQRLTRADAGRHFGVGGRHQAFVDVARGELDAGTRRWDLTEGHAGAVFDLGASWQFRGTGGWVAPVDAPSRAIAGAAFSGSPTDGVRVAVAADRRPFRENGATVATGLMASGTSATVQWQPSAHWHVTAAAGAAWLGDGNLRRDASAALARRASYGSRDVEWRASSFVFGFRRPSAQYFSPTTFARTDFEVEVRQWFGRPRFDGDRRPWIAGSVGGGVDVRGVRYDLGSARVTLPVAGPWVLAGEGRWVRSRVFRSTQAGVLLQVGGR